MKYPTVLSAKAISDYYVVFTYDNGETRKFDVKPYICGDWFGKLRDMTVFNTVRPCGDTIEWIDGQDIAPHELYDYSVPC